MSQRKLPNNRKADTAAKQTQALESNACDNNQSLVPATFPKGEYLDAAHSAEREVDPMSRGILSNSNTTMDDLYRMAEHELDILAALNNEGRQIIKTRLMVIWEEMSVRFERGESINGISGTGGKGMGKYLRSIGVDPAKRRYWKFEIRKNDALRLAQENPPIKTKSTIKKDIIINGETEADLVAKAGVKLAQMLAGTGTAPTQASVQKAAAMADQILEAVADGQYSRLEPLPEHTVLTEAASFSDWKNHQLPAADFNLKYFEDAAQNFLDRYLYGFQGSAFKKILGTLKNNPQQVLSNAHDFVQLAVVLRGVAQNANLLASVITTALNPPPQSEPQPKPEPDPAPEPAHSPEPTERQKKQASQDDDPKESETPGNSKRSDLGGGVVSIASADGVTVYFRNNRPMSEKQIAKFLAAKTEQAKAKTDDMAKIEKWGKSHRGSAKEVRAQCVGLSNTSTAYIMRLLNELADAGRLSVTDIPDKRYIGSSPKRLLELYYEEQTAKDRRLSRKP